MKSSTILRALMILAAGISAAFTCAPAAFAQGCALCYTDAAATGPHAEAALRHGILVLMIPPTLIIVGLFSLLYLRRNMHRESAEHLPVTIPSSSNSVSEIVLHLN